MSSASKLRQAIRKKRQAMSVLHPNMKRRAAEDRGPIKIGRNDGEDTAESDEQQETRPPKKGTSKLSDAAYQQLLQAREANRVARCSRQMQLRQRWIANNGSRLPDLTPQRLLHPDWWTAEEERANKVITNISDHAGISDDKKARIRWNFHMWGFAVRQQGHCTGTERGGDHQDVELCTKEPFQPSDFFGKGGACHDFAHWAAHKRNGNEALMIHYQAKNVMDFQFVDFLKQGRFLRRACHNIESWCH